MSAVGTIKACLTLDRSEAQGSEPVRGEISLCYRPLPTTSSNARQELFGPLRLGVVLCGNLDLRVAENRTSHAYIFFTETFSLFRHCHEVFNGSLRIAANETKTFAFTTQFPKSTRYREPVPPSFKTRFSASAVRQAGKHQGSAHIHYELHVDVDMAGICVDVVNERGAATILYRPPAAVLTKLTSDLSQSLQIQTYDLLPDPPSNLMEKSKAILKSVQRPIYMFRATAYKFPLEVAVDQAISVELCVRVDTETTTATVSPEITLHSGRLVMIGRTRLHATDKRGVDSVRLDHSSEEAVASLVHQTPEGPFSKQNDYTKTITFEKISSTLPSSFLLFKCGRAYRIRLELKFIAAGQSVVMKRELDVKVVPPIPVLHESSVAGSSHQQRPPRFSLIDEVLPTYEEVASLERPGRYEP